MNTIRGYFEEGEFYYGHCCSEYRNHKLDNVGIADWLYDVLDIEPCNEDNYDEEYKYPESKEYTVRMAWFNSEQGIPSKTTTLSEVSAMIAFDDTAEFSGACYSEWTCGCGMYTFQELWQRLNTLSNGMYVIIEVDE